MSRALDLSNKFSYQMVKFTYGDSASPSYAAYTNWPEIVSGNPDFEATPALLIKLPENVGTVENKLAKITLPQDTFTLAVSSGLPVSKIDVTIYEKIVAVDPGDSSTLLTVFSGVVQSAVRNPDGKAGVVQLTAASAKLLLETPLGIPSTHQCVWTFGEGACEVSGDNQTGSLFISVIEGKKITVTGLRTSPAFNDRNFHRGYIERAGIRIGIREWRDTDYSVFYLVRQPPSDWLNKGISAYAGCDKTIECCRSRHSTSGEQYFMGCGYSIPSYNPLFEGGS